MDTPEAWLRGPVDGIDPMLVPVAHALIQAREDIEGLVSRVPAAGVWERPGGAASIGFHVRHLGGALDRLLTYARGEALSEAQRAALKAENVPGDPRRRWPTSCATRAPSSTGRSSRCAASRAISSSSHVSSAARSCHQTCWG